MATPFSLTLFPKTLWRGFCAAILERCQLSGAKTVPNRLMINERRGITKNKIIPLLVLLGVVTASISLFLIYGRDPAVIAQFQRYGYPGAFLVSLIGNASVFLFMGTVLPVLASIGAMLYPASGLLGPVGVGLAGGAGAAIGEIAGYTIGYSGRGIVEKSKRYEWLVSRVKRKGAPAVFVLSLFPLVFDVVAIAAGALRLPLCLNYRLTVVKAFLFIYR